MTLKIDGPLSIHDLNLLVKEWIDACPPLNDIWVLGEISNYRRFAGGSQRYFSLNDRDSTIQCVIFDALDARFDGPYRDGVSVIARGKVRFFNRKGTLQLQINYMMPKGEGSIRQNIELLQKKLAEEGLFDSSRKQPIPQFPSHIGLITALDSAAQADVVRLFGEFAPSIKITVCPTTMQGLTCPSDIIHSMDRLEQLELDLILITRGGGSFEDLLPFSEERLLRRLAHAKLPVVVAIGHETDAPLIDYLADATYPTPSAAAVAISRGIASISDYLRALSPNLSQSLDRLLDSSDTVLNNLMGTINSHVDDMLDENAVRFAQLSRDLDLLSPLRKLDQGFSISRLKTNQVLSSVNDISVGQIIHTELKNGRILSQVIEVLDHG